MTGINLGGVASVLPPATTPLGLISLLFDGSDFRVDDPAGSVRLEFPD